MTVLDEAGAVLELRQYTLHPGRRDMLIALFEREFIEPQRACGIRLPGQFRDLDRPDRFVWLRGFADLAGRASALADFYGGPAWRAHHDAANATMIDSDDVLLLRPVAGLAGAPVGGARGGLIVAGICTLDAPADEALLAEFAAQLLPWLHRQGAALLACWVSDPALVNNFPRLQVREGEHVLVWLAHHPQGLQDVERPAPVAAAQLLRLLPTAGSALQIREENSMQEEARFIGRPGDFDFLVGGRWRVRNRRLHTRLVGAADWTEFEAVSQAWRHLGGQVSVDEIAFETEGFAGCTLRTLNLQTRQWAIYWINSRCGQLFPPVHGGWDGARGEFYGEDEDDGRPVRVRFVWERLAQDRARWTQAFSVDGGATWEDNWVMDMEREMEREPLLPA